MSDDQIKLTGDLEVVFENPPNDKFQKNGKSYAMRVDRDGKLHLGKNWEEFQRNGETWYRYTWRKRPSLWARIKNIFGWV